MNHRNFDIDQEGYSAISIVCLLFLDSKHSIGSLILKDAIKFCECTNNTMDPTLVMRVTKTYIDRHLVKKQQKEKTTYTFKFHMDRTNESYFHFVLRICFKTKYCPKININNEHKFVTRKLCYQSYSNSVVKK